MNVSLRISLIFLSVFLTGALRLPGQGYLKDTLEVFQNGRGEYYFEAVHSPGGITSQARHGRVWVESVLPGSGSNKIYKLIYEPTAGYVGLDTFRYSRLTCFSAACFEEWEVLVRVKASEVHAAADLFYVPANSGEVPLDVLRNDSGSSGSLSLRSVSTVNNGQATVVPGSPAIMFKPKRGFTGVAQLIYTVCDPLGACSQASASIVVGQAQAPGEDTLRIFTLKNLPVDILVPEIYALLDEPAHGDLDQDHDIPKYTPEAGFVGSDYLIFAGQNGSELVVEVKVLDHTRNRFAIDDQANITPGRSVEIDVLENDAFGSKTACVEYSKPLYGKLSGTNSVNGIVTYHAPAGFVGVDEFTYTSYAPGCTGEPEVASVRVFVSNFEPAFSKFRMNTPMNTPLVITYNVPVNDYEFSVSQKAKKGELLFLRGLVDTVIMGNRIFGFNMLLYMPALGATGMDEFEVVYCLRGNGSRGCAYQKSVKIEMDILPFGTGEPMCFGNDCIWAGDTNQDGIVNMEDILPLGRFMGRVGVGRDDANLDVWYGQFGQNWQDPFAANSADLKHIDTDGNSIITAADTLAISRFFGRTHAMIPSQLPYADFEIRLEGDLFTEPGEPLALDILIGDEDNPVTDLYGFTFNISYNPFFFDADASTIEFNDHSWLTYNSPVLSMTRNDGKGNVEAGFTRTNDLPAVGYGKVGRSKVVVTVDIIGVAPPDGDGNIQIPIGGGFAVATNVAGQQYAVRVVPTTLTVRTRPDASGEQQDQPVKQMGDDLLMFPNPASDQVLLFQQGEKQMERIQVFSMTGQLMLDSGNIAEQQYRIPVSDWAPGVYVARVMVDNNVITRKLEVVR